MTSEEKQKLIKELMNKSPMIITTAYLYALNLELYGVDVTRTWLTATQNACALSKAYEKGYYDALKQHTESEV